MIPNSQSNNKRIAKNTGFLYIRMLLILGIGLFTSRIVLQSLGVEGYGVYNVVGGVVASFGFLNMSLTNASSRFISIVIGEGNEERLKRVTNCIISIHYVLAIFVMILLETVGLWFLSNHIVLGEESKIAAYCVFECSAITMIIGIISAPYNAMIISHEKTKAFAYVSIFECLGKLAIAYLLFIIPNNYRLIIYAIMLLVVQLIVRMLYTSYCRRNFREARFMWRWDSEISKPILKFAFWTMNGNLAVIGYTQGLNILLNMYFGPAVNSARGISVQIQSAMRQFYMSFQTALNPQIMKSYAKNDLDYMHSLIINGSKYSFYLILALSVPIIYNIDTILNIWLTTIPPYTAPFIVIMLCICLFNTMGTPLNYGIHATGNLKVFQIVEGGILLMVLPIAWCALARFHASPVHVFLIYLFVEVAAQISRIIVVLPRIGLKRLVYVKRLLVPVISVDLVVVTVFFILKRAEIPFVSNFFVNSFILELTIVMSIWYVGMRQSDRGRAIEYLAKIIRS